MTVLMVRLGRPADRPEFLLGSPFLSSDLVNMTHTESCNLRSFSAPIPAAWNLSIVEQHVYVSFAGGACEGRWTRVSAVNGSCLVLNDTAWDDGQVPCIDEGPLAFQLSYGPWAKPAFPPLACPNCPRLVRSLYTPSKEEGVYDVVYTPTRKGQYSVVTSIVGDVGLFATYYSMDVNAIGNPVGSSTWDKGLENEFAVDWSSNPNIQSPGIDV